MRSSSRYGEPARTRICSLARSTSTFVVCAISWAPKVAVSSRCVTSVTVSILLQQNNFSAITPSHIPVLPEDKLVASQTYGRLQSAEAEASGLVKFEDLFRFRHFIRIAANPVDRIAPMTHPSLVLVRPAPDIVAWLSVSQCTEKGFNFHRCGNDRRIGPSEWSW